MSVLRSLFPRTYAHEEPDPCPEHGRLSLRGVTWHCDWTRTEMREGRHGFYRHVTRCTYRPGRTVSEVEPWEIDDGGSGERFEPAGRD